ncbi:MAG: arylsulfotransferase family protein [Actinobacteria bacterium]|nr:arylsulfotransferase family protein [Actinomycetota bacterium]
MTLAGPAAATLAVAGIALALEGCSSTSSAASPTAPTRHYHSQPDLKPPLVEILKRTRRMTPGYIFIAPKKDVAQAGPLILDNGGRVVWFRPLDTHGVTDFRVQRYLGRAVLTWWHGKPDEGSGGSGYTIYDSSYRLVAHVQPGNGMLGDIHEFKITPRNTALMTISRHVRVKGRKVLEGGLQELDIKTGRVLFEWHSIDHVQLVESYYRLPKDPGRTFDYFHVNSIEIDEDGNLIVSARNTHTIYKISRRTGKILWRLGGKRSDFTLGRGVRFAWQHDARRRPDGDLTLFDNSAGPQARKQSRGLVLRLDMKRMHAAVVRTFVHRPPIVAVDQGNMQRLANGHYLVGWGHQPHFTEFGPRGTILFDGRFGRGRVDSYRAYRFPWSAWPAYAPVVAVKKRTAYVSWNGSTAVVRWQLVAGPRKRDLRPIRLVAKTGFETRIPLRGADGWIAVRALDRDGHALGRTVALHLG